MTTPGYDTTVDNNHSVLVLGAGIAGMTAALHLAHLGLPVSLLDAAPTIGGSFHLLDHTFPTNSCGICLMAPKQPAFCPTFECDLHPNLTLLPFTELLDLQGQPGHFSASLQHKPRFVDPLLCTGCGLCASVCPIPRPHDYEGWLSPVKAIFRPPGLRAVPDAWLIDMDYCTRCGACVSACPTHAIDLDMPPRLESLSVTALLLTPGFAPFDPRLKGEYGYQVYDNVLSALEFERLISLAGSTVAHLTRPSDGRPPRRIAFVHCVGSRDLLCGAGYCSSACCMFTAKQVALAKQLDPTLDITVFFMDLRASGKNFEAYVDAVQALPGVTYRRAMPSSVYQRQQSRSLALSFAGDDGKLHDEEFDLLVLATGFAPPRGLQDLARRLGVALNDYGFARTLPFQPTHTNRPGIYVAGAFREPKDIPDTVAEAVAAAAQVAADLQSLRPSGLDLARPTPSPTTTPLRDLSDLQPRIGVFVCDCHGDLDPLQPARLAAWAAEQPAVAFAHSLPDACCPEARAAIRNAIDRHDLNRLVLAGCSQRLFSNEFEALMRDAGLDPRLLSRVNLRDQVLLPHAHPGACLMAKAQSLLNMALAATRSFSDLQALALTDHRPLTRQALVLGGGAAGLSAALTLARLQIPVHLVERLETLGGQWRHICYQPENLFDPDYPDPQTALDTLIHHVQAEPLIHLHLGATLQACSGSAGRYRSTLLTPDGELVLEHGVLLLATGGQQASCNDYLYGLDPRVLTQRELELQIADGTLAAARSVVMIQCAGSREPLRPYCSRVCCTQAIKNALKLKQIRPDLNLFVLYRDIRTFGFREAFYQAARDAGVVFLRYELPLKPQALSLPDHLQISLTEPLTGQNLTLSADLLVLSVGIDPAQRAAARDDQLALAQTLNLTLDSNGFFLEEHAKMKPLDLNGPNGAGLYFAGLAHSPRFLEETIAQAQAAAMRAAAFLAPVELADRPTSVWVNPRLCSFCGLCVQTCPYQARVMNYDTRVADVDYALCHGCGLCAVVCPNKATLQKAFEHKQLLAAVDMAVE